MSVTVFIINGQAKAGKDTLIKLMEIAAHHLVDQQQAFSSIDSVREAVTSMGIDVSTKTDRDRDLMSTIGNALQTHSEHRTKECIDAVLDMNALGGDSILYLHVREPIIINQLMNYFEPLPGIDLVRVHLVGCRGLNITSNPSDAGTSNMEYDFKIENNHSFGPLMVQAENLIATVLSHNVHWDLADKRRPEGHRDYKET